MKTVLTIAGTDPTGGAGAQADLKTFMAHKVYGMSIMTSLVAQNTLGVKDIMDVTPYFLEEQFQCVFEDIYPDAVKIGMVSQPELIHKIVEQLKKYQAKNIVVDPVMVSTSGSRLLADSALEALKSELIPLSCIITPNIPETEVLVNHTIQSKEDMIQAAKEIQQWYQGAILIKGGHFEKRADDLLVINNEVYWLECEHIDNPNTHGTGCTLSSAIASNLALGYDLKVTDFDEFLDNLSKYADEYTKEYLLSSNINGFDETRTLENLRDYGIGWKKVDLEYIKNIINIIHHFDD